MCEEFREDIKDNNLPGDEDEDEGEDDEARMRRRGGV